jgi:hypothetical protein
MTGRPLTRGEVVCGQIVLAAYLAYGILGIYLEWRAHQFELTAPPRADRYNLEYYAPEGRRWVKRSQRWHRWRWAAWLGGGVAIALGCGLLG